MRFAVRGSLCTVALVATAHVANAATCEELSSLSLPNTTITIAQPVARGQFVAPVQARGRGNNPFAELPAFCRVAATLKPSSDSDIKIEVWLPLGLPAEARGAAASGGWNGKLEAVGNGGWAGNIGYAAMANALRAGYATVSTDTGHSTPGGTFALGHPEKLIDYAYRSEHEMTVTAKAVVNAFYGRGASRAYFNGCSTGGRQALVEATKYPDDFDGIVAGAAANPKTGLDAWRLWAAHLEIRNEADRIPPEKFPMIHKAVVDQCDALDGVKDGLIENPAQCHFDPSPIVCKAGSADAACLTPKQAAVAKALMGPAKTSTGREVFPGYAPGSELGWAFLLGNDEPYSNPLEDYRYVVFRNPNWDWKTFDLDRDLATSEKVGAGLLTAVSQDLSAFTKHGGKLLTYHGWSDQQIPPGASINFYNRVTPKSSRDAVRLFMIPGMGHCGGGEGPNTFDMVSPLDNWVEHGEAPARIVAAHLTAGKVDRTRPLCAYPQVARYKGTGDINQAENFVCAK
ncbi:MAG TPA: tannase/feruloyl esterase family alpha/beta hydrolase [Vicinamibacterales bacterium]|nr:tannase/feruloyl esterase family alpha/beta hydrolase [Vicinamibacterales bacterium]